MILKSTATTTSTTTVKPRTNPATTRRSTLVDKHLFPLARCCPSSEDSRARKQSRNVDPRSEAKPEEGHCSLSWFLCHTQSAFLYDSVLTSVATSHSGLDRLPSIISHDNVQQTGWQTNVVEAVPQLKFFLPWCLLFGLCWLKTTQHTCQICYTFIYIKPKNKHTCVCMCFNYFWWYKLLYIGNS